LCEVGGIVPKWYKFSKSRGRGGTALEDSLRKVSSVMGQCVTSLRIREPRKGTYSFEQLCDAMRRLTPIQREMLKGKCSCVAVKDRDEFESMYLRAYPIMMKVRDLEVKAGTTITINAYNVPFPVVPLECLMGLQQTGTRLREVELTTQSYKLEDLFLDASIMQKHAVLLLGSNRTTGFGKTQMALRLAIEWCIAMNKASKSPPEDAQILISNTIDVGKGICFKPGMVWVLDEFSPCDAAQLVHCSENLLKILFTCNLKGTLRGRNSDISVSHDVARIITGNADSGAQWVGKGMTWSQPLRRKSVLFQIGSSLVSDAFRRGAAVLPDDLSVECSAAASAVMAGRFRAVHSEIVSAIVPARSSLFCPLRR
jgi:hypothetical protein